MKWKKSQITTKTEWKSAWFCVIQETGPQTGRESDVARRKMKMVANIFPEGKGKDIEIAHFLA